MSTRGRLIPLIALILAFLTPGFVPVAEANHLNHAAFTAHAPILIASNADWWTGSAVSGVRSGTGTEADPFIISGWVFDVSSGAAITIRDTTKVFTIRDNLFITGASATGIQFRDSTGLGRILGNDFYHRGVGVTVTRATALVADNVFQDTYAGPTYSRSVVLDQTISTVRGNTLSGVGTGVDAKHSEPVVEWNDFISTRQGVLLTNTDNARIDDNTFTTSVEAAITSDIAVNLRIARNTVEGGKQGFVLKSGEAYVEWNTFTDVIGAAIKATNVDLTANRNTLTGGRGVAIDITGGHVDMDHNTVRNALGTAIQLTTTTGRVARSDLDRNGGGIGLVGGTVVELVSNGLDHNVWGYSIPYASRQAIPLMWDNWANGENIDGSIVPQDKVYHWRESNILYNGVTRDSGFANQYHGSVAKEGGIVFYDVTGATVINSYLAYHLVGVYAENSFNVVVQDSLFVNNGCGVVYRNVLGFVKGSNISLEVDPPGFCGIDVYGGWVGLYDNDIYLVEIGIRLDAAVQGEVIGNTIVKTHVGMHLTGTFEQDRDAILVRLNLVKEGKVGITMVRWQSTFIENTVYWNTRVGVRLESGASPLIANNNVTFNLQGVSAIGSCGTFSAWLCAHPELDGNLIAWNVQTGVRLNATANMEGNAVLRNGAEGVIITDGGGHFRFNNVSHNGRTGMIVYGTFADFLGNNMSNNLGDGIRFTGTLAVFRRDTFSWNLDTGMALQGGLYVGLELKVNANLNGIIVTDSFRPPALPEIPGLPAINLPQIGNPLAPDREERDPLWIHLSEIAYNRENAIRAPIFVDVNATYNWWGSEQAPAYDTEVTGNYGNTVTLGVRYVPWFRDQAMTETGPIRGL